MLDRSPASAKRAARNRRHRERVRKRRRTFMGEIDEIGIGWLIAHGYLQQHEADDARTLRAALGRAVSRLIALSSR